MHTASPQQALGFSRAHTVRRTAIVGLRALSCGPGAGPGRLNVLLIRITRRLVRWVVAVSAPIGPIRVSEPSAAASELPVSVSVRETRGRGTGKQTPNQQPRRSWARRRDAVVGPAVGGRTWHCRSRHLCAPLTRPARPTSGAAASGRGARPSGHLTVLSTDQTGLTSRHSASSRRAVPSRHSTARRCRPLSGPARRGPWERGRHTATTHARSLTERAQTILRKINRVQLSIISTRRPIATSPHASSNSPGQSC